MSVTSHALLVALGVAPSTAAVVGYFALNPTARPTVRELQRTLHAGSASVQRDLSRLTEAGALRSYPDGRMIRYAPVTASPLWKAVRILLDAPAPGPPRRPRERAAQQYGVDVSLLRSNLRRSVEERLQRLDADISFLAEARRGKKR